MPPKPAMDHLLRLLWRRSVCVMRPLLLMRGKSVGIMLRALRNVLQQLLPLQCRRQLKSHVTPPQHLSDGLIELFGAADFFEAGEEVFGAKAAFLGAAEVMNNAAAVHHDEAGAPDGRLLHRECDHERWQLGAVDDLFREPGQP